MCYPFAHSIYYRSPLIGGSLTRPAERFPDLFGHSDFLKNYPYFPPCALPATFSWDSANIRKLFRPKSHMPFLIRRTKTTQPTTKNHTLLPHYSYRSKLRIAQFGWYILSCPPTPLFFNPDSSWWPWSISSTILSCFGILNGLLFILFFVKIHERWGTKRVFVAGVYNIPNSQFHG